MADKMETKATVVATEGVITGKVKWFDVTKGYGFIVDENGNEVFVHFSDIQSGKTYTGFDKNDKVTFEIKDGKNGPQAANVNIIPSNKKNK